MLNSDSKSSLKKLNNNSSNDNSSISGRDDDAVSSILPNLKLVTLNIWGIKYVSKKVGLRIKYLITALNQNDYDIIALQEVWSLQDYHRIKGSIQSKYPFSHYFQSGLIGSGCCLFSKHPIISTFYHRFSVNGYAHQLHRGDWFGGKLVGLALVDYHGIKINVYVAHLHANYSTDVEGDYHLAHRYAQLFELSQFIRLTSGAAAVSVLLGDLNTFETENGYKFLRLTTNLLDTFFERPNFKSDNSEKICHSTCHAPTNKFSKSPKFPDGIRIDYILFKGGKEANVECVNYEKCLGKIPTCPFDMNFSDHEGVYAELKINTSQNETGSLRRLSEESQNEILKHLLEFKEILSAKISSVNRFRLIYFALSFIPIVLLFLFNKENEYLVLFKNVALTLIFIYLGVYLFFMKSLEKKTLGAVLDDVSVMANQFLSKEEEEKQ